MTATGDPAPDSRPLRSPVIDGPLVLLLLLLPTCVWWINFGAPWILPGSPGWGWSAVLIALGVWLLAAVYAAFRRATGPESPAAPIGARTILSAMGTIAYLLLGAGFLTVLGPGIAPVRSSLGRALVGALMLACAWTGWTALHPGARRSALHVLVRLFRRS